MGALGKSSAQAAQGDDFSIQRRLDLGRRHAGALSLHRTVQVTLQAADYICAVGIRDRATDTSVTPNPAGKCDSGRGILQGDMRTRRRLAGVGVAHASHDE